MKVLYASDLHLEFHDNSVFVARQPFQAVGDVLVLAGDTFPLAEFDTYSRHRFFDWCAEHYRETLLIPGNHEYYRAKVDAYPDSWEKPLRENVRMCSNRVVRIGDTDFILSTLWSHIPYRDWPKLATGMSDFSLIRMKKGAFTATSYNDLHERDLAFVKDALSGSDATHKVVVTHHVPSRLLVAPEFKGSSLESGFTVDLTGYIEGCGADLWVYGHSHRSISRRIGDTLVVSNQIGYVVYGEYKTHFSGDRVADLDNLDASLPEEKPERISLSNRRGGGVALEQTALGSPWYKLTGNTLYTSIIGDSPIEAFDPEGGPCITLGSRIGQRIVMELKCIGEDLLIKLK